MGEEERRRMKDFMLYRQVFTIERIKIFININIYSYYYFLSSTFFLLSKRIIPKMKNFKNIKSVSQLNFGKCRFRWWGPLLPLLCFIILFFLPSYLKKKKIARFSFFFVNTFIYIRNSPWLAIILFHNNFNSYH